MQASSSAFELALSRGEELGGLRYGFETVTTSDKLATGTVATLRTPRGDHRVTIERVEDNRITLAALQPIDPTGSPLALVLAPWFLYDRLIEALDSVGDHHGVDLALALFGKAPHARTPTPLVCDHGALDPSQRAAVQLCSDSDLAFVWGPPLVSGAFVLTIVSVIGMIGRQSTDGVREWWSRLGAWLGAGPAAGCRRACSLGHGVCGVAVTGVGSNDQHTASAGP